MDMSFEHFEELSRVVILAMKIRYEFDANAAQEDGTFVANRLAQLQIDRGTFESHLTIAESGDI